MLYALGDFFNSSTVIGWATFLAELLVAAVIYFELEQSRRLHFLEKATAEHADHDRREIYETFLAITGFSTLEERSAEFVRRMFAAAPEVQPEPHDGKVSLRQRCDRQIALFNDLGITVDTWYSQSKVLVEVFPHAAVYMWIILHPYILQRRKDTGKWLAKPLLKLTFKCATFVLNEDPDRGLHLRQGDGKEGLVIPRDHLLKVEQQLAALLEQPLLPRVGR